MDEKLNNLIRIGKILLLILGGLIALAVWLAYELSVVVGVPSFKLWVIYDLHRRYYRILQHKCKKTETAPLLRRSFLLRHKSTYKDDSKNR